MERKMEDLGAGNNGAALDAASSQHIEKETNSSSPRLSPEIAKELATARREKVERMGGRPSQSTHERNRLPIEIRRRIVELFATFQPLNSIIETIKDEFGQTLHRDTVRHYDPTRLNSKLSPSMVALFNEVRTRYVEQSTSVAIAHQAHRLRRYETIIDKAERAKDFSSALKGLELAAKEMGGVLTNVSRTEVKGQIEHRHLSIEDAKAELAMRLQSAIEGGTLTPLPSPTEGDEDPTP
jgi:hypothetical protein